MLFLVHYGKLLLVVYVLFLSNVNSYNSRFFMAK